MTEHLENWYEWSRKIINNQHELNMLTSQYSQLQNSLGDNSKAMLDNLRSQSIETQNQLRNTQKETKEKKEEYKT